MRRLIRLPWQRVGCLVWMIVVGGCSARQPAVHPALTALGDRPDALAVYDALEALIAVGHDTPADRQYAYRGVCAHEEDSAAYTFARAAVTGRLVQQKGLLGAYLIPEVERYAWRSRELDPTFRDGAATRLLGTLYVIAPATVLRHGNSEVGLELLEGLSTARPDIPENHLRLAEAYLALSDAASAVPHLCWCLDHQARFRPDDQTLLRQLVAMAGPLQCTAPARASS